MDDLKDTLLLWAWTLALIPFAWLFFYAAGLAA